jgi:hypothetical protein
MSQLTCHDAVALGDFVLWGWQAQNAVTRATCRPATGIVSYHVSTSAPWHASAYGMITSLAVAPLAVGVRTCTAARLPLQGDIVAMLLSHAE